jgi:hypothetical protein
MVAVINFLADKAVVAAGKNNRNQVRIRDGGWLGSSATWLVSRT